MERRKFEESFQDAFKDAEVNPSENVWTNIELDLEKAQGDKMKRRLLFFQTLAAASIAFAMCVAGIGYYLMNSETLGNLAHQSQPAGTSIKEESNNAATNTSPESNASTSSENENAVTSSAKSNSESLSSAKMEDAKRANDQATTANLSGDSNASGGTTDVKNSKTQNPGTKSGKPSAIDESSAPLIASGQTNFTKKDATVTTSPASAGPKADVSGNVRNEADLNSDSRIAKQAGSTEQNSQEAVAATNGVNTGTDRKLPMLYQAKNPQLSLPAPNENIASTIDPGMKLLLEREAEMRRYAEEDKKQAKSNSEKLWTSVGFAAGGFAANNPSIGGAPANSMYAMNSSQTASQQSKANGISYSVGVGFGTKLSERWVLQGGLSYLTQSSDYTANGVVVVDNNYALPQAASLNAFAPQLRDASADTKVASTFPYNVNNNVRFVSVPLQAGYLLVNKKFGMQLNAGVATDLFLQNTITPDGAGLTKTTQGRGDESPYRSLNFSGLMGTEFSYRLGYHYRLSLNPGVRYPFSSVYKSNTGIDSNPVTFDVGLRFKYIFH